MRRSRCGAPRYLIIRVDRADLSKNVLRGFTAFDVFLEQHPEFREKVTFIAHLQPSRQDVPEYARSTSSGSRRWSRSSATPRDRRLDADRPAHLRELQRGRRPLQQLDLLMVNSLFDGMNLVAKEAPAVNTRDGMVMLSENTGAHEELGDCALSVNPFDIPGAGGRDLPRAHHGTRGARAAGTAAQGDHLRARPRRLDRRAARGHPGQAGSGGRESVAS